MKSEVWAHKYKLHLIIPVMLLVAALLISRLGVLLLMGLGIYAALFGFERESCKSLTVRLGIIFLFIIMGCLPLLFNRASAESYRQWGNWGIDARGVNAFVRVTLRCVDAVGAMLLFTQLTPIYQLCAELRALRIPRLLIDLFELTYRYIFVLEETIRHISTAQVARLGYVGSRAKVKDTGLLLAQTLLLTQHEANHLYDGLVSRGYEDGPDDASTSEASIWGEAVLSLRNISFAYEADKLILKQIDLILHAGERIALLGENGTGKSTLFLLLNGILKHETGEYCLRGVRMGNGKKDMRTIRRIVSLVFQNSNYQLFTPSVYDEVAYGLKNIGFKGKELSERVEKVLCDFELQDVKHFPPHKLSEGRKKWVAIAAIIATDPEIIILDEPTSNLDRYYTNKVVQLLDELHNQGKTIIISTHDMNLAYRWAERVLVMHEGQIVADDKAAVVFAQSDLLSQANLEPPLFLRRTVAVSPNKKAAKRFHLPIFMNAVSLPCLVVGGGWGAARKVETLLHAGAECTVIAPDSCTYIGNLFAKQRITYYRRTFHPGDTLGFALVVAATENDALNKNICEEAASCGALYNSLSDPMCANFHFCASSVQKGVGLAIHTEYRLPEVARLLRDYCTESIPADIEDKMKALYALRMVRRHEETNEALKQQYDDILHQIDRSLNKL